MGLQMDFLPMVPRGGTIGLQMDFFFSSSFKPPTFGCKDDLCGQCGMMGWGVGCMCGGGGYCTVDRGSCAEYALLFFSNSFLNTTNFLFLLGTENANFQTGLTFQATPVTPISSCSFSFYFLECFCLENCPLLSRELSTDSRQSSDSYCSSVQSSPGPGYITGSDLAHK